MWERSVQSVLKNLKVVDELLKVMV
jgi:hypothetical protein